MSPLLVSEEATPITQLTGGRSPQGKDGSSQKMACVRMRAPETEDACGEGTERVEVTVAAQRSARSLGKEVARDAHPWRTLAHPWR